MKGQCPNCETRFNIDDLKIPDKGVYGKCPKCSERIFLSKTVSATTNFETQSRQENSQDPSLKSEVSTNSLQNNKTINTQTSMSPQKTYPKEKIVPLASPSMRWIRNIAMILGAAWFFPLSCTIGMIAGPHVISQIDARKVEKGEELHPLFKVVAGSRAIGMDEVESIISGIKEADDNIQSDSSSMPNLFLLSEPSGRFESESSIFTYTVVEDSGDEQLIELREDYKDGDNTIWSGYKAQRTSITPLSTRMLYFGYMFMAAPFVFFGSFFLFVIGRILISTIGTTTKQADSKPNKNSYKALTVLTLLAFILGGIFFIYASIQTIKIVNMWMIDFSDNPAEASLTMMIFSIIFSWFKALVPILLGYFVSKRKQLHFSQVLSGILCIFIPFGTIVGIISFVILLRKPVKQQFSS
jgi:predicted Zn finger-like uncharacterized protein